MKALEGYCVVKEIEEEKKTAGGLILPDTEKPRIGRYELISVNINDKGHEGDIVYIQVIDVIKSSNFEPGIGIVKAEKIMAKE